MFPLLCGTVQFNNSIMPLDRANTSPFYISIVTGPNTPLPEKKKKKISIELSRRYMATQIGWSWWRNGPAACASPARSSPPRRGVLPDPAGGSPAAAGPSSGLIAEQRSVAGHGSPAAQSAVCLPADGRPTRGTEHVGRTCWTPLPCSGRTQSWVPASKPCPTPCRGFARNV